MEERLGYFLLLLLAGCRSSAGASDIIFDVFEYGGSYRHLNSPMKFIPPSRGLTEVCEGESFMLQCPKSTFIKLARNSAVQFGRGGAWEASTRCGARGDNVTGCGTVNAKKQILAMCTGKEVCGVHLNGMFRDADPCPGPEDNYSGRPPLRPRKYLTVRFSCVSSQEDTDSETTTERIRRNHITKAVFPPGPATEGADIEVLEHEFYDKLDTVTEINDDVKDYVEHFLEDAFRQIEYTSPRFGDRSSVLGLTERVGQRIMGLLDDQEEVTEFLVHTSQMTLKLVKKKYNKNKEGKAAETKWRTSDTKIVLPDQEELAEDDRLEITMASYNNLQEELESASDVITVSVNKHVNLSKPVTFLLRNNGTNNVSCAFWSFPDDFWSRDGCETVCHNGSHTMCSCSHLTNFALIFNVHEDSVAMDNSHLDFITYVGFTISIVCMVLTIVVFLATRGSNSNERDVIHINLCISLLTAEVIFIFGISKTSDATLCSIIAALLHYFFLASFAWMFLEGFQIYKMLYKVFDKASKSTRKNNFLLGYLLPLLIVLSSFLIDVIHLHTSSPGQEEEGDQSMCSLPSAWTSYGTQDYCWLRLDNHFVLSFIVPAVVVIASNIGFLLFALHSMLVHKFKPANQSSHDMVVSYMKGVGVLMALLGSTWVFGLLFLAFNSLFLAYSFTILNSLQGVGIFVFQCVLNPAIRSVARRRLSPLLEACGLGDRRGSYRSPASTQLDTSSQEKPLAGNSIVSNPQ